MYAHIPHMDDTSLKQLLECPLQAVLQCQQENPDANFKDLSSMARAQLISQRPATCFERFFYFLVACYLIYAFWNRNRGYYSG